MIAMGGKIGIVCTSNGQLKSYKDKIDELENVVRLMGLEPVFSPYIYEKDSFYSATGTQRAEVINQFFADNEIQAIFDISGGDIANEVLEYLDYDRISKTDKKLFGYSDLTPVLNAIYAKTGKEMGLYQIRNLIYENGKEQQKNFVNTFMNHENNLTEFEYIFLQGCFMEGTVIGGNIRCFLKLAGTEYMPDFTDKILLLEGLNSTSAQVVTYLCQLKQMGVFKKINGVLLGTFTKLDQEIFVPSVEELIQRYAGEELPIARTMEIGHGSDSKCVMIGKSLCLKEQ